LILSHGRGPAGAALLFLVPVQQSHLCLRHQINPSIFLSNTSHTFL
jgi:hypothetical protein